MRAFGIETTVSHEPFSLETTLDDHRVVTAVHPARPRSYSTVVFRGDERVASGATRSMRAAREAHVRAVMELVSPTALGWNVTDERPAPSMAELRRDLDGAIEDAAQAQQTAGLLLVRARTAVARSKRRGAKVPWPPHVV